MPVIPTRFAVHFGDWVVRALNANEEAARFGAEFKVKIVADHQPVPPPR